MIEDLLVHGEATGGLLPCLPHPWVRRPDHRLARDDWDVVCLLVDTCLEPTSKAKRDELHKHGVHWELELAIRRKCNAPPLERM